MKIPRIYFLFSVLLFSGCEYQLDKYETSSEEANTFKKAISTDYQEKAELTNEEIDDVKSKLRAMRIADQETRKTLDKFPSSIKNGQPSEQFLEAWKSVRSVDERHLISLDQIVETYGWIDSRRFGEQAESDAWLLVQHMVYDRGVFQEKILNLTESLILSGEASAPHFARLSDRIKIIFRKEKQLYGSQGKCVSPGLWEASPMEEVSEVEAARLEVGLKPFKDHLEKMSLECK